MSTAGGVWRRKSDKKAARRTSPKMYDFGGVHSHTYNTLVAKCPVRAHFEICKYKMLHIAYTNHTDHTHRTVQCPGTLVYSECVYILHCELC